MITFILLIVSVHISAGVIYHLNDADFSRMPPIYEQEDYDACLRDEGVYCVANIELISDAPNELMNLIVDYSAHVAKHFNHSHISRGVCLTKTCEKYIDISREPNLTVEKCLNDTLWEKYKFGGRVYKTSCTSNKYYKEKKEMNFDVGDIITGAIIFSVLIFTFIGTVLDEKYNRFFACFSLHKNWKKLTAPSGEGPVERLRGLKSLSGMKTLTIVLVIMAHSPIPYLKISNNMHFIEQLYDYQLMQFLLNGTMVVQTFFVISGFLLTYNIILYSEKNSLSWTSLPKFIILRWIRLSAPYGVILLFLSTWLRHIGYGPNWEELTQAEIEDCQNYWWLNLLYFNNYFINSQCMQQTWYIASDFQLYILGLIVCLFCKGRILKIVIGFFILFGILTTALHTYFQDLNAVLLVTPEAIRYIFTRDPTFNNVYKRGHTNITSFFIGIMTAHILYYLQGLKLEEKSIKKYRFLTWLLLPLGCYTVYSGNIFYRDGPIHDVVFRTIFAGLMKPVFPSIIALAIVFLILKTEEICRGILELNCWGLLSRISYAAYLLHVSIIRITAGFQREALHASYYNLISSFILLEVLSFLCALPLWLLFEAPVGNIIKELITTRKNLESNLSTSKMKLTEEKSEK